LLNWSLEDYIRGHESHGLPLFFGLNKNQPLNKLKLWLKATTQSYKTAVAPKMRKASSPHPPYTNPTKQVSNLQYELSKRPSKNRSVLSYVKTAFKSVVGAFTILLPRKSKADDSVTDAGKSNKQVGGISCKLSS